MSSKKKKKKTGPGIGEFRKSARTGFLDENAWEEASSGAQVRFTEEFDKVMDEESTWLTPKEALTLTQASESTGKPRLAAIHKMILGQKYKTVSDAVKKAKLGGGMRGVIETYNPTKQCEAALSQFAEEEVVGQPELAQLSRSAAGKDHMFTTCWLCGGLVLPIGKKETGRRLDASYDDKAYPDCEHILPALSAALFRGLFVNGAGGGGPRSKQRSPSLDVKSQNKTWFKNFQIMTANNYLWSHNGCNGTVKKNYFPIKIKKDQSAFELDEDELTKMAKEMAGYVGGGEPTVAKQTWMPHPECIYGGTTPATKSPPAGYNQRLSELWVTKGKKSKRSWGQGERWKGAFWVVRSVLGYKYEGDRYLGGTAYTAYNGCAVPYMDDKTAKMIVMVPRTSVEEVRRALENKKTEWNGSDRGQGQGKCLVEFEVTAITYAGEDVDSGGKPFGMGGENAYKSPLSVYKTEYGHHLKKINAEYEQVKAAVIKTTKKNNEDAFRCFATYLLQIGRLYFATSKTTRKGAQVYDATSVAGLTSGIKIDGGGKKSKGRIQYGGNYAKRIENLYDQIYDLQLYYTQEWSNIDYNILEMTNIKQDGGGVRIQKGGNETISQSQIMNFFTYLLLGNNTDRKLALLNVTTDSNALASLWNPPKLLRSSTQLPEPVVAVTCQIMSWILIWLQHGPQYLKKYNPSKKNSAIGGDGGDAVKNRALLTLQSVPLTTKAWEKKSPVAKTRGPTGDVYTEADYDDFINQICCLLNAAFRFIEASNIKSKRLTRSNYGKKVRDDGVKDMGCGSGNVSKEACLSCDGANPKNTKIGKTRTYGAVMDKIRSTIGFFDSSRRSGLRSNKLLGDINNCLKRYYCDEKWVEFGLDKPCNPERSVSGGGYKRTKKKRRRRHTRRRRRRRKRKTRHRKQRRRRRRRTRR